MDTSNKFLIRKDGDGWKVGKALLLSARLTSEELLNLAAWAVALIGPDKAEWEAMLRDIRGGQAS